ncbi:hypothetical protein [Hymenobacter terricola]|uniref:hypothetical protein n=1 Tax=Hymenobacter terricola TaxID=2819236 RepID=UPI001CF44548|nr:hypothetical protein [Hymenobacter terricola]
MHTVSKRILLQLLLLMLPLVAVFLLIMPLESEDRIDFAMLLSIPFAALFLIIFGRAIFTTLHTIITREPNGLLKASWLGSAFVLVVWLGTGALLFVA